MRGLKQKSDGGGEKGSWELEIDRRHIDGRSNLIIILRETLRRSELVLVHNN